jgi:hypothetical protein
MHNIPPLISPDSLSFMHSAGDFLYRHQATAVRSVRPRSLMEHQTNAPKSSESIHDGWSTLNGVVHRIEDVLRVCQEN